ncbi:MAG: response regulator transcription factor [Vallitaleaceae bacterium]|nr:response regulator transcription factor [Vallitaleaceae bacterium]
MKVLIVDDDRLVAAALKTILEADSEIEIVGVGHDGADAMSLYRRLKPDVLLMDIRMKAMSGLEAAEEILKVDAEGKILFLTTFTDDEYIIKAIKIGAKGYIIKQNFESIVPAVKTVFAGQRVYGDEIIGKISGFVGGNGKAQSGDIKLGEKEFQILEQVAGGLSNKEIAECLFLSEGTVRNYISVILEKLQLRDRTQLAIFYYKQYV